MHVLGIESSCDDTGVAIIRQDGHLLSNCLHSQLKIHLFNGGILPMLAKDYHVANIDRVARQAFDESGLRSVTNDIDAIAVSTRPGLHYSLQVGLNYARKLAKKYSKPLIPIHHMHAHALMPLLNYRTIKFPFMTLLISGGHCLLSICERYNKFHVLGSSIDDAPGDLLDKFARRTKLRNLGHPFDSISGGAAVELLSQRLGTDRFKYMNCPTAIPLHNSHGCDFSFSGYRGNLEQIYNFIDELWDRGDREILLDELGHLSASLQRVILVQFFKKLKRAMAYYRMHWRYQHLDAFKNLDQSHHLGFELRERESNEYIDDWLDVVVSGGCAANKYFVDCLRSCCYTDIDASVKLYAPEKNLCSDNGAMIAWNGMLRFLDYNLNPNSYKGNSDINDAVIFDPKQIDLLEVEAKSPMGPDISSSVAMALLPARGSKNSELKYNRPT